jgi:hypothetical protein
LATQLTVPPVRIPSKSASARNHDSIRQTHKRIFSHSFAFFSFFDWSPCVPGRDSSTQLLPDILQWVH